ncbi:SMI1/KNR4 family protein [Streptomyces sp. NPDC001880]
MDEQELLAAVRTLVTHNRQKLVCSRAGHGEDHACLPADEDIDLSVLIKQLRAQYGQLRNLAMDGYVDPTVTGRTGAPLLVPFGDQVVEMCAWKYADWWVGCGGVRDDGVVKPVVLVAGQAVHQHPDAEAVPRQPDAQVGTSRQQPLAKAAPKEQSDGLTQQTSWVDQVVAATGWTRERGDEAVDWATVESRLGTALPGDYKELVERFGYGDFDDYLGLLIPNGPPGSLDLIEFNEFWARAAADDGGGPWEPYRLYPAPGGLLQWDVERGRGRSRLYTGARSVPLPTARAWRMPVGAGTEGRHGALECSGRTRRPRPGPSASDGSRTRGAHCYADRIPNRAALNSSGRSRCTECPAPGTATSRTEPPAVAYWSRT